MSTPNKNPGSVYKTKQLLNTLAPNPAVAALMTGATVWGASRLAYPWVDAAFKHATRSLSKEQEGEQGKVQDALKTPEEKAVEAEQYDKGKRNVPIILGGLAALGVLAGSWSNAEGMTMGGLFNSWDDPRRYNLPVDKSKFSEDKLKDIKRAITPMRKESSFSWDINDQTYLDFGKILPVRTMQDAVLNDPYTEVYHKGNALDIINDASRGGNDNKITAGNLFDSALNKVQKNLTVQGVTNASLRAVLGYGTAKVFTEAMGNIIDMPKGVRNAIIDAGMISNVIKGLY